MRQQASWPGRRDGVAHLYDTRTGLSCDRPGATCESNVLKRPASVREERVLCKSILSPQREPKGESIIRRSNHPCYQKCDADSRNFCRSGKNFQNRFPNSTTFLWLGGSAVWRSSRGNLTRQSDLPPCLQGFGAASELFCVPPVQAVLLHASLLQRNYSSGDCRRSIAILKL